LYFQLSIGGTPTASNYYWSVWTTGSDAATAVSNGSPGTSVNPAFCSTALPQGQQIIELTYPFTAANTVYTVCDNRNDSIAQRVRNGGGIHLNSSSHDGIRLGVGSGTMTGVVTVYGYRKA
jgi:hypothetical protein